MRKATCKGTWCPLGMNVPQWCPASLISAGKHILHGPNKWGLVKPNLFIYLVGAVRETKQPVIQNIRQRTKILAAHCTKCCPWESKVLCHAVLARSLPTASTEINLHRGLKGSTLQEWQNRSWNCSAHPPLVSSWNMRVPDCMQEPSSSWIFLHNICQHTLTFSRLSMTWYIAL